MKESVIAVISVVAVLILLGFLVIRAIISAFNNTDKTLKAFVDMAIPDILKNQSVQTWSKYAGPELMNLASSSDWKYSKKMKNLDDFQYYEGSEGREVFTTTDNLSTIAGRYVAKATFSSGPAQVYVTVCRMNKKCYLTSFRIRSKARSKAFLAN